MDVTKANKKEYDEWWREFVNMHEQYIELLVHAEEKDSASRSYEEQMNRKINLVGMIAYMQSKLNFGTQSQGNEISTSSRTSSRSSPKNSSRHCSRPSTVSKKMEKLALAQLERNQLLKQQEFESTIVELKFEKEALDAQMEEERVLLSLNVYKEEDITSTVSDSVNYATVSQQQPPSPLTHPFIPQPQSPVQDKPQGPVPLPKTNLPPKKQEQQFEAPSRYSQVHTQQCPLVPQNHLP